VLSYTLPDFLLTRVGTGIAICLDVDNVWQRAGVRSNVLDVYDTCDVETAVAYENADPGLFRLGG
jgi:hypothetical protein